MVVLRLVLLTLLLNLIRYFVGGPIEAVTIMEPMHRVMPQYPAVFDADFTSQDFAVSLLYNFMLWFAAVLTFHLMAPTLKGPVVVKSLKAFGVAFLSYASLAAVYMNHYSDAVKPFYFWSIVDGVITFSLVALANGLLYPWVVGRLREAP